MRLRSSFPLLLFASLLLMGCRLYGSHGNEEAHRLQMRQALESFEASLVRNQADLQRLTTAAVTNPALASSAEAMAALVALQEAVLTGQRVRLAELEDEDDYRALSRSFGAMITEQQMIADRYAEIAQRLRGDASTASYVGSVEDASRYVFVPPQYYRTNNRVRAASLDLSAASAQSRPGTAAPADTVGQVTDGPAAPPSGEGAEQE